MTNSNANGFLDTADYSMVDRSMKNVINMQTSLSHTSALLDIVGFFRVMVPRRGQINVITLQKSMNWSVSNPVPA